MEERRLANGLRVIVERDARQPLIAVVIAYDVGQRDDPPGYRELAHLVEHLTFRGSRHLEDGQMVLRLDAAGATWNAYTTSDHTVYMTLAPARQSPLLWLESERMAFAAEGFTQKALDVELGVVRSEWLERGSEGVGARLHEFQAQALYPQGHPYRHLGDSCEASDYDFDLDQRALVLPAALSARECHARDRRRYPRSDRNACAGRALFRCNRASAKGSARGGPAAQAVGQAVARVRAAVSAADAHRALGGQCRDLARPNLLRLWSRRAAGDRSATAAYRLVTVLAIASEVSMDVTPLDGFYDVTLGVSLAPEVDLDRAQQIFESNVDELIRLPIDDTQLHSLKQGVLVDDLAALEGSFVRGVAYAARRGPGRFALRPGCEPERTDGHHRAADGRLRAHRARACAPVPGEDQSRRGRGTRRRALRVNAARRAPWVDPLVLGGCASRPPLPPPQQPLAATPDAPF